MPDMRQLMDTVRELSRTVSRAIMSAISCGGGVNDISCEQIRIACLGL